MILPVLIAGISVQYFENPWAVTGLIITSVICCRQEARSMDNTSGGKLLVGGGPDLHRSRKYFCVKRYLNVFKPAASVKYLVHCQWLVVQANT